MKLAVIPARGGSKRIPRKNIREFGGRPMIAHAISAATESGLFDNVVVSTDDKEIAAIAREWRAETPFLRPAELADDHTPTVPVVAHAVKACRDVGMQFDHVCCIYPSVPFIRLDDLKAAFVSLVNSGAAYSFPIAEFPVAIQRALRRDFAGRTAPFFPQNELVRTQDLETAYHDAGQFYWGHADAWLTKAHIHSNGVGIVVPAWRVVDIDTAADWERAEFLYAAMASQLAP